MARVNLRYHSTSSRISEALGDVIHFCRVDKCKNNWHVLLR